MSFHFEPTIYHVAIIMDGNGRWAAKRGRPRFWGHIRGSQVISEIVERTDSLNIKALTLYAFSTENWSRPLNEIKVIFRLLQKYIEVETERIIDNNIRFKVIGDISSLPLKTKRLIEELEAATEQATGLKLNFAFSYGGKKEIVDAVNFYIDQNPGKSLTEEDIEKRLLTNDLGEVDLLIRTGGDYRISNFLLWQSAYAELRFSETLWPDFTADEFTSLVQSYRQANRRFGTISSEIFSLRDVRLQAERNRRQAIAEMEGNL